MRNHPTEEGSDTPPSPIAPSVLTRRAFDMAGLGMMPAATDVQTVVIAGTGHGVAEQAPEEMLAALAPFLAPYLAAQ